MFKKYGPNFLLTFKLEFKRLNFLINSWLLVSHGIFTIVGRICFDQLVSITVRFFKNFDVSKFLHLFQWLVKLGQLFECWWCLGLFIIIISCGFFWSVMDSSANAPKRPNTNFFRHCFSNLISFFKWVSPLSPQQAFHPLCSQKATGAMLRILKTHLIYHWTTSGTPSKHTPKYFYFPDWTSFPRWIRSCKSHWEITPTTMQV